MKEKDVLIPASQDEWGTEPVVFGSKVSVRRFKITKIKPKPTYVGADGWWWFTIYDDDCDVWIALNRSESNWNWFFLIIMCFGLLVKGEFAQLGPKGTI